MTVAEARAAVEKIRAAAGDDEIAHSYEDDFRASVLKAIAEGSEDAVELAEIALTTGEIQFARWCA